MLFQGGVVNGTAINPVCGGLPHLRKCDFLNIVKTNIPLRFKEIMIKFYFYYFNCWFMQSNSEKHWKTQIGHVLKIIVLFRE